MESARRRWRGEETSRRAPIQRARLVNLGFPHLRVVLHVARVEGDRLQVELAVQVNGRDDLPTVEGGEISVFSRAREPRSGEGIWCPFFRVTTNSRGRGAYCSVGTIPDGCTLRSTASSTAVAGAGTVASAAAFASAAG